MIGDPQGTLAIRRMERTLQPMQLTEMVIERRWRAQNCQDLKVVEEEEQEEEEEDEEKEE